MILFETLMKTFVAGREVRRANSDVDGEAYEIYIENCDNWSAVKFVIAHDIFTFTN